MWCPYELNLQDFKHCLYPYTQFQFVKLETSSKHLSLIFTCLPPLAFPSPPIFLFLDLFLFSSDFQQNLLPSVYLFCPVTKAGLIQQCNEKPERNGKVIENLYLPSNCSCKFWSCQLLCGTSYRLQTVCFICGLQNRIFSP